MQFAVNEQELQHLRELDEAGRLQYFLTRTLEAEEIWAVADTQGWLLQEDAERSFLQIWPYAQLAQSFVEAGSDCFADAISLDDFVQRLLGQIAAQQIELELLALPGLDGIAISAEQLFELYESLLDAGDYYLEG